MPSRVCVQCRKGKPLTAFRKLKSGHYKRTCKSCLWKRRWDAGKERINQSRKLRRIANPAKAIFADARLFDRKKGFHNDLTLDAIETLISNPCLYCGETKLRMTLDRKDNATGHVLSNVNPACVRCNFIRNSMPYEAWLYLAPRVREARLLGVFGGWTGRFRSGGGTRETRPGQPFDLAAERHVSSSLTPSTEQECGSDEKADVADLKSAGGDTVRVRVPRPAL